MMTLTPTVSVISAYQTTFIITGTPTTTLSTLSLHDALPILCLPRDPDASARALRARLPHRPGARAPRQDRKSTRPNSSHITSSYAVLCLKKKIRPRTQSGGHGETQDYRVCNICLRVHKIYCW